MAQRGRGKRNLSAEIQSLTSRLANLERGRTRGGGAPRGGGRGRGRSRSRSRGRQVVAAPQNVSASTTATLSGNLSGGSLRGQELFATVTLKATKAEQIYAWWPCPTKEGSAGRSEMVRHNKLGLLFARWKFLNFKIWWVPRVSMMTAGSVHLAISAEGNGLDAATNPMSFADIAGFQASSGCAVYERTTVTASKALCNPDRWYVVAPTTNTEVGDFVRQPFVICLGVQSTAPTTDTVLGELWCSYSALYEGFLP